MKKNRILSVIAAALICLTNPSFAEFTYAIDEAPADAVIMEELPADFSAAETAAEPESEFIEACEYAADNAGYDMSSSAAYPMDVFIEADSELTDAIHTILKYDTGSEYGYADPSAGFASNDLHEDSTSLAAPARDTYRYYYDRLTPAQQKLWDDMDKACDLFDEKCISTNQMYGVIDENGEKIESKIFYFGSVKYDPNEITSAEVYQASYCYYFSRPDRFYLSSYRVANSYTGELFLSANREFSSYNVRSEAHSHIAKIRDEWLSQLDQFDTELEKETYLCTLVVDNTNYNYDCLDDNIEEFKAINQVMGGSLFYGTGVCTSYAMFLAYMCQAAGIEAVVVRSNSHAWIRAELDGKWYESDPTWFDGVNSYSYQWINCSTKTLIDRTSDSAHDTNDSLTNPTDFELPECVTDAEYPFTTSVEELTIEAHGATIRVSWPEIKDASYYAVYIDGAGTSKCYKTSYGYSSFSPGKHKVELFAYNNSGNIIYKTGVIEFEYSDEIVTGVTAKATGHYTGEISWEPYEGATKYFVYKLHNGEWLRWYSTINTSIPVGGLTPGVTSTYAVKACFDTTDARLESAEFSKPVTITTSKPTYKVSGATSPEGLGKVTVSKTTASEGDTVTITAPEIEGYIFTGWKLNACGTSVDSLYSTNTTMKIGISDTTAIATYFPVIDTEPDFDKQIFLLHFDDVKGAIKYLVAPFEDEIAYYENKRGGSYVFKSSTEKVGFYNLEDGKSYNIALLAIDENNMIIAKSKLYSFIKMPYIKAEGVPGETLAQLSWTAPEGVTVAHYCMRRYASPDAYFNERWAGQYRLDPEVFTGKYYTLSPDNEYYLGVVAVDSNYKELAKSNLITVKTYDTTVKDLTAAVEGKNVTLTWSKVNGAEKYYVYECNGEENIYIGQATEETFTKTNLADGSYEYIVKAIVLGFSSKNCIPVKFTIGTPSCIAERTDSPEGVKNEISVIAEGQYRWQKKYGSEWKDTGCTTATFTVSQLSDGGEYRCIITDASGAQITASSVTVNVIEAAKVTTDMVAKLDPDECAEFVNAFTEGSEDVFVLTEAMTNAIERVLAA